MKQDIIAVALTALLLLGGQALAQSNHAPSVSDMAPVYAETDTGQTNVVIAADWKSLYPFSARFPTEEALAKIASEPHIIDLAATRFATDTLISTTADGKKAFAVPNLRSFPTNLVRDAFDIDARPDTQDYYLVQAASPEAQIHLRQWLDANKINILGYIPQYAYLVRVNRDMLASMEQRPEVFWTGFYQPAFRVDPNSTM